ncbi:MAG: ferritin-like domain-containing protein [archaeon]|nr:ferritin-like domain-containing protein [archaeon]
MSNSELIGKLNGGLGWELRAAALYSHYSAYIRGINRLHLKPFFDEEASESHTHAEAVRAAIVKLGGVAVTDRDSTEIVHTTDYKIMLTESLKTEQKAAEGYEEVLALIKDDEEMYDSIEQIYFQELRSVEEVTQLL